MCFTDLKDLLGQWLGESMQLIHCEGIKFFGPWRCKSFGWTPLCALEVFFSVWTGVAGFRIAEGSGLPVEVSRVGYPRPFPVKGPVLAVVNNNKVCEIFCYFPAPQ